VPRKGAVLAAMLSKAWYDEGYRQPSKTKAVASVTRICHLEGSHPLFGRPHVDKYSTCFGREPE